jgi:hypothetical protein
MCETVMGYATLSDCPSEETVEAGSLEFVSGVELHPVRMAEQRISTVRRMGISFLMVDVSFRYNLISRN